MQEDVELLAKKFLDAVELAFMQYVHEVNSMSRPEEADRAEPGVVRIGQKWSVDDKMTLIKMMSEGRSAMEVALCLRRTEDSVKAKWLRYQKGAFDRYGRDNPEYREDRTNRPSHAEQFGDAHYRASEIREMLIRDYQVTVPVDAIRDCLRGHGLSLYVLEGADGKDTLVKGTGGKHHSNWYNKEAVNQAHIIRALTSLNRPKVSES